MTTSDGFISNLVGIHDITGNSGSVLPRRYTLNVVNGLTEDVGGVVQISTGVAPVWLSVDTISSDQSNYAPTGFAAATEVPVTMATAQDFTSFDASDLTVYEKRLWNVSGENDANVSAYTIKHQDGSVAETADRVICPGAVDLVVAANAVARIIYDTAASRWRAMLCSV